MPFKRARAIHFLCYRIAFRSVEKQVSHVVYDVTAVVINAHIVASLKRKITRRVAAPSDDPQVEGRNSG